MVTIVDLEDYLKNNFGKYKDTCSNLSENPKIKSKKEAFAYDNIKLSLVGNNCESADALIVKKWINFIEFKTGFANPDQGVNIKTHKENLKLRIRLKAYESLALFEKLILAKIKSGKLQENVRKRFIAVIDSNITGSPEDAMINVFAQESGKQEEDKLHIFKGTLLYYCKQTKDPAVKKLFYDEVEIWNDFEFDTKVERLK